MGFVATLVAIGCSAILTWAGLQKLLSRKEFGDTLAMLGLPARTRFAATLVVPVAELSIGAGLLLWPRPWTGAGVVLLGLVFAGAGLMATRSRQPIHCSCFGAIGGWQLGWKQVALLPVWIGCAYLLYRWPTRWEASVGIQYLAGLIVLLCVGQALSVLPRWRSGSATRTAVDESIKVHLPILTRVDNAKG